MPTNIFIPPDFLRTDTGRNLLTTLYGQFGDKAKMSALEKGTNITPEWAATLGLAVKDNQVTGLAPQPTTIDPVTGKPYQTYRPDIESSNIDAIRNRAVSTDQETIDQSINGLSTNNAGFATSTNLGGDYIKSLVNAGLISDQEQKTRLENISAQRKSSLESNIESGRSVIDEQFRRKISEAEEIGKTEVSYARAMMGRFSGGDLGADTSLMGMIQTVQKGADARIANLESQRREAMANLDYNKAQQLDTILNDEADNLNSFYKESWQKKLDVIGLINDKEKTRLTTLQWDWEQVSKIKSGKTWVSPLTGQTYTGAEESELSNAEWINIANNIPMGETQTMTINGKEYTITGIGKPDVDTQIFESEDASGNVTYTIFDKNKATSDPDYVPTTINAGQIGKGKEPTEYDKKKFVLDQKLSSGEITQGQYDDALFGIKDIQANRDEEFEKYVNDLVNKVYDKKLTREQAKAMIKTKFSDYDENVIYDFIPDELQP